MGARILVHALIVFNSNHALSAGAKDDAGSTDRRSIASR